MSETVELELDEPYHVMYEELNETSNFHEALRHHVQNVVHEQYNEPDEGPQQGPVRQQ